jgi:hypothetical protein
MTFKIGDEVKLIPDAVAGRKYGDITLLSTMFDRAKGKVLVVHSAGSRSVSFKDNPFGYSHEMFVLAEEARSVEPEKVEEKPRKKKILYPVGTVGENKWGTFKVIDYKKGGIQKPYKIEYTSEKKPHVMGYPYWKTLDEMKTFTYNTEVDSHPQETVETPVKSISTDEVEKLIKIAEDRIQAKNDLLVAEAQKQMTVMAEALVAAQLTAMNPPMIIYNESHNKSTPKKAEKKSTMATIREKIRYATLSSDEKILRETGILSENGNLTEQGRRVLLDILFEDEANRKAIVSLVKKTLPKESK